VQKASIEGEHQDVQNPDQEGDHEVCKKRGKRLTVERRVLIRLAKRGAKG
jgi:hypothetical protein